MASLRKLVGILVVAATAAGCAAEGGEFLIILNNSVPDTGCEVMPAGTGDAVLGLGTVDAYGAVNNATLLGYMLTPTIMNIGDSQNGSLRNERTVLTDGARVRVLPSNGSDGMPILTEAEIAALGVDGAFTSLFTVPVYPDGGVTAAAFDVLPTNLLRMLASRLPEPDDLAVVRVEVTITGETLSGTNVQSDTFTYPITVCNGCQVVEVGACAGLAVRAYAAGGACNPFQDGAVECCTSATGPVCPALPQP